MYVYTYVYSWLDRLDVFLVNRLGLETIFVRRGIVFNQYTSKRECGGK